jgi:hypothetical protein
MRGLFAAAALVGLTAAGAGGQEAVTFQEYPYQAGDKTRTTKTDEFTTATTFVAMGQEQKKNEKRTKTLVYTTEVLEVGPDATKPAKLRRTYEKAVEVRDGNESKLPLAGQTVVIEKTAAKYVFTGADGVALAAEAAADLNEEFNKKVLGGDLLPKGAVKPGDSWDLTEKFLAGMAGPDSPFVVDPKGAVVTGKLLSVTKKGGTTFGDLAVTADLPLAELRGKQPLKLNPGSFWKIDVRAVAAVGGSSPEGGSSGTMRVAVAGAVMGVALKVDTRVKTTGRTERAPAGVP